MNLASLGQCLVRAARPAALALAIVSAPHQRCQAADAPVATAEKNRPPVVLTEEALAIHRDAPVIDGHNDLPWTVRTKGDSSFDKVDIAQPQPKFHTDIARLRKGGIGAQFWSAYVPAETGTSGEAAKTTLEQIELIHEMIRCYPDTFEMVQTADDIDRIRRSGKIASMIGIEGGHSIENSLEMLRRYYDLGARYMTLTHSRTLDWADSATDLPKSEGLSPQGEEIIRAMNRLGMLVDISHVSVDTMHDALRVTRAPVIASHSSAFGVAPHPRNVPDDVLREVAANGGVIMVNFFPSFTQPERAAAGAEAIATVLEKKRTTGGEVSLRDILKNTSKQNEMPRGSVHTIVDHIEHIIRVAGIDHVGLGSDYDGIESVPDQLEDVSCYPYITQEMLNRGYSAEDIRKVLGGNVERALRQAERVAQELRDENEKQ